MASVTVARLLKRFGQTEVLKGVSLSIPEGAFAVLVGPSGCGNPPSCASSPGWRSPIKARFISAIAT